MTINLCYYFSQIGKRGELFISQRDMMYKAQQGKKMILCTFKVDWRGNPRKKKTEDCHDEGCCNHYMLFRYQQCKQYPPGSAYPRQHDKIDHVCVPGSKRGAETKSKQGRNNCPKTVLHGGSKANGTEIGVDTVATCCLTKKNVSLGRDCFCSNYAHNY